KTARQQDASLCPNCFALVPAVGSAAPPALHCERGLIEGAGYRVEVSDAGLVPWLRIDTPRAVLFDGREPGRYLTKLGLVLLVAALAMYSTGNGDPQRRRDIVDDARAALETNVARGAPASYLGALWRLTLEDRREDEDIVAGLAEQIARCFDGSLALGFLSTLLPPLMDEVWTPEALCRLRVLVAG